MDARQHSLSTARNREPIFEVLRAHVRPNGRVLEIASGAGEHAVFFASKFRDMTWRPSDPDPAARASIVAWTEAVGAKNVLPPFDIDVTKDESWSEAAEEGGYDALVAINMIHIAPWEATKGLMIGAGGLLHAPPRTPDGPFRERPGVLVTYGPYKSGGRHTAPSNEAFDVWLKERDPRFGVRDLEEVEAEANAQGLALKEIVEMPANNLSLVFERSYAEEIRKHGGV